MNRVETASGSFAPESKIELERNADGLLVKAESEYAKNSQNMKDWLKRFISVVKQIRPQDERAISQSRLAERPSEERLQVHENIIYNQIGQRALLLDLYTPREKNAKPWTVVIFVHGGGWIAGAHLNYRPVAMSLAARGFACMAVEYRLAGEAGFPAAVWDVKAAVRWVRKNPDKYHLNPTSIVVAGGSAGGNIAGLVGATNGDPRFEGDGAHHDVSSEVHGTISLDGVIGHVAKKWAGDPATDPWLYNEGIPLFHMIQRDRCPPLLFVKGGEQLVRVDQCQHCRQPLQACGFPLAPWVRVR